MVRNCEGGRTIVGDKETEIPRALLAGEARAETRLDTWDGTSYSQLLQMRRVNSSRDNE
jgi:hypothetical protein